MKKLIPLLLIFFTLACNLPAALPTPTPPLPTDTNVPPTATPIPPPSETSTPEASPTATFTFTPAFTNTETPTLPPTATDGPSATPTFDFPTVTINQQAHCRYGPSKAHLHAADLYVGDTGTVRGRFQYSKWLYVKFDKLKYFCWVAPSVVDLQGDISKLYYAEVKLPGPSVLYRHPQNVQAVRLGNKRVKITWDRVNMTQDDDRGYMLELFVCQGGYSLWWTAAIPDQYTTSYEVQDEEGCTNPSGGVVYAVEKHGYTTPAQINWP